MAHTIRGLREADLPQLFAIREVAYLVTDDPRDPKVLEHHKKRLPFQRGHFIEDTLTSAAIVYPFEMCLGGRRVPMGGLAGVLSAPEHRRRGFVEALLRDALTRLHEGGVGWCLEYPFDPRYYARYGWRSVPNGVTVSIPSERLLSSRRPEVERCEPGEATVTKLDAFYQTWAEGYNFTLSRNGRARDDWRGVVFKGHEEWSRLVYVLEEAYCVLELSFKEREDRETLHVHDYAFVSPAGREELFAFWGSFHGQVNRVEVRLPTDDPLLWEVTGWLTPDTHPLQARIVDVTAALTGVPSDAQGTFTVRVHDAFCAWNDATFRIESSRGGCTVSPTNQRADTSLDIRALALLLSGAASAEGVKRMGGAEGELEALRALEAFSEGHTPFMAPADYF